MTALRVDDLDVQRGGISVLQHVCFTIASGRALILRGANGVGKTSLLRTIAGLQKPRAGTISLAPESIAYAAHSDGLKAALTVRENLTFWARIYGETTVENALAQMQLSALQDRLAGQLSAGQKRRLGLARLLVTGRPVWLLDEPTVSLDVAAVALFAQIVQGHLAAGGMTLIASHIDLGLPEARIFDLTPFRAKTQTKSAFDEAFL